VSRFPFVSAAQALLLLRVVVGGYMAAHGLMRAAVGTVDDFGLFLTARGFPAGVWLAWAITVNEIVSGLTLASGRYVRLLSAVFIAEHLMGIALVHAPRGWFTVGHQVGGAEYSVLLIVCFVVTAATTEGPDRPDWRTAADALS
jgi:putative oxidoreductase